MNIKAWAAAAAVMAVAAGLQWVSGIPFSRNPDEALFVFCTLVFAAYAAAVTWIWE